MVAQRVVLGLLATSRTASPLGESLSENIAAIRAWAYAHIDEIDTARADFDARPPESE